MWPAGVEVRKTCAPTSTHGSGRIISTTTIRLSAGSSDLMIPKLNLDPIRARKKKRNPQSADIISYIDGFKADKGAKARITDATPKYNIIYLSH